MAYGSQHRCILHSKLIDWDFRTRIIEHRLQSIYGQRRRCSIASPAKVKRSFRRNGDGDVSITVQRLARAVIRQLVEDQPQVKVTLAQEEQRLRSITSMINTLVPASQILDRPLKLSKQRFRSTHVMPSYLSDLPSVCLNCVPKNTLVRLVDELVRTKCMSKLQQFGPHGSRSPLQMGSALVPTWPRSTPNQSSSVVNSSTLATSTTHCRNSRSQYRPSTVIRGHQAHICIPRAAVVSTRAPRTSSIDSVEIANGPQATVGIHFTKRISKTAGTETAAPPVVMTMTRPGAVNPIRSRLATFSSSTAGVDDLSIDGTGSDSCGPRVSSRRSTSCCYTHKHSKQSISTLLQQNKKHSRLLSSMTPIYPATVKASVENPFCSRIDYQHAHADQPLCVITMSSPQRKKYQLRDYLNNIEALEQFHPQLLPATSTRFTVDDRSYPVPLNAAVALVQFNSSRSTSFHESSIRPNVMSPHVIRKGTRKKSATLLRTRFVKEDANVSCNTNHRPESRFLSAGRASTNTNTIDGKVSTTTKTDRKLCSNPIQIQNKPNPGGETTDTTMACDKTNCHFDLISEPAFVLRTGNPSTPPYTPIWIGGYYDEQHYQQQPWHRHEKRDVDSSQASDSVSSDRSLRTWLHLPHPTPEVVIEAGLMESPHLLDALDLEWTWPVRKATDERHPSAKRLELILPKQLHVNSYWVKSMDVHHIDSPLYNEARR